MSASNNVESSSSETSVFSTLTQDELVRGQTPADIEQRCLALCAAFIGGTWCKATTADITVKRITGGLTNQLYRVTLKRDSVAQAENVIYETEPTDVAIKLFQSKFLKIDETNERLDDIIILTAITELDIGPKVYGIFNEGTIQEYIEHEHFRPPHQQDPAFIKKLANLLVRIHRLDVPIRKNDTWPVSKIDDMLEHGYSRPETAQLIEDLKLTELKGRDLRDEFKELKGWLEAVQSPIVFSHNDYIGTNILVTKPDQRLVIIDFEYSSYFARGWDIAVFYAQWGIEPFDYDNLSLPEDEVLQAFIRLYIEANEKLEPGYAAKADNCPEKLLREVKLYTLLYLFYLMGYVLSTEESLIETIPYDLKTNMKYVEKGFKRYNEIKRRLIGDGTIKG